MPEPAALRIESLRCVGFRGLDADLVLEPRLTVLVGRNNAGKSRILRALALAVGAVSADRDDLTLRGEVPAVIDVVVAPALGEEFEDRLGPLLNDVRQATSADGSRDRYAWRTTVSKSAEGFSATASRTLLRWEPITGAWIAGRGGLQDSVLRLTRGHLIETGRDLAAEIRQRGTAAYRLLDDLALDPAVVPTLQAQLDSLSAGVVAGSRTLQEIKTALDEVAARVDAVGAPQVLPVPGRVDDLSSVVSVELDSPDGHIPLRLHGTGARSLTSLRLQGVLYEHRLGADGGEVGPHPLTMIEEPEAHLHPHAQLDLPRLLARIPGQVIVSTHSTHFITAAKHEQLRILTASATGVIVKVLQVNEDPDDETPRQFRPSLYVSEMEKLRRSVERPFGELLFSTAVVVGDGATERALLPPLLRHALGPLAHGICVVDPESMNGAVAIAAVKAARLLDIPWLVLADGDQAGRKAAASLIEQVANDEAERIALYPVVVLEMPAPPEQVFAEHDPELCEAVLAAVAPGGPTTGNLLRRLKAAKGTTGPFLADELIRRYPAVEDWPQPLQAVVEKMRSVMEAQ